MVEEEEIDDIELDRIALAAIAGGGEGVGGGTAEEAHDDRGVVTLTRRAQVVVRSAACRRNSSVR